MIGLRQVREILKKKGRFKKKLIPAINFRKQPLPFNIHKFLSLKSQQRHVFGLIRQTFSNFFESKHQTMNRDNNNPHERNENKPKERINLNDYYRKDDSDILKQHSASSRQGAERGLNEQMGETDGSVTGEPSHI